MLACHVRQRLAVQIQRDRPFHADARRNIRAEHHRFKIAVRQRHRKSFRRVHFRRNFVRALRVHRHGSLGDFFARKRHETAVRHSRYFGVCRHIAFRSVDVGIAQNGVAPHKGTAADHHLLSARAVVNVDRQSGRCLIIRKRFFAEIDKLAALDIGDAAEARIHAGLVLRVCRDGAALDGQGRPLRHNADGDGGFIRLRPVDGALRARANGQASAAYIQAQTLPIPAPIVSVYSPRSSVSFFPSVNLNCLSRTAFSFRETTAPSAARFSSSHSV